MYVNSYRSTGLQQTQTGSAEMKFATHNSLGILGPPDGVAKVPSGRKELVRSVR
jgi:hypothetical protein